jgi:hypothetical protein
MLRRVGFGILWGFVGYLCRAFGGGWLVSQMSSFAIGAWRAARVPSKVES